MTNSQIFTAANKLASQIYRNSKVEMTWPEALSYAHGIVREHGAEVVKIEKKSGEITERVVNSRLTEFIEIKGVGSYNKLKKFIDLAKVAVNEITGRKISPVISAYRLIS